MKKIPYAAQFIDDSDVSAVSKALKRDFLTQGPLVNIFEKKIADFCGVKYAVAVNSGTSALHIACLAAGLKKGDEGITSPITFVATANCMLYCGAKTVFADIDPATICIDPKEIEKKISKRTKIIIPVHFAGYPCDMKKIHAIAKEHGLLVIEDACHALGSEYRGKMIGSCKYSDMTVLSFHAVKHITTGEGGAVLTNNKKYYEKLKILRSHGITRNKNLMNSSDGDWFYEMQDLGFNYRLTDFQCALGISQLNKLGRFVKRRNEIAKMYDSAFFDIQAISSFLVEPNVKSARHIYVLGFDLSMLNCSRKEIFDEYRERGILVNVHYIPVYKHPYYQKVGGKSNICQRAEAYYRSCITLPLYPKMSEKEVEKVINATRSIVNRHLKATQ